MDMLLASVLLFYLEEHEQIYRKKSGVGAVGSRVGGGGGWGLGVGVEWGGAHRVLLSPTIGLTVIYVAVIE